MDSPTNDPEMQKLIAMEVADIMKDTTAPTNWPDPKNPYMPLFPERSGWHVITIYSRPTNGVAPYGVPSLMWWDAENTGWRIVPTGRIEDLAKDDVENKLSYVGPVLTPAQIAEMLSAERERCAKKAEKHRSYANPHAVDDLDVVQTITANDIAKAIRNLGDAP